jgi:hypothetical protein
MYICLTKRLRSVPFKHFYRRNVVLGDFFLQKVRRISRFGAILTFLHQLGLAHPSSDQNDLSVPAHVIIDLMPSCPPPPEIPTPWWMVHQQSVCCALQIIALFDQEVEASACHQNVICNMSYPATHFDVAILFGVNSMIVILFIQKCIPLTYTVNIIFPLAAIFIPLIL